MIELINEINRLKVIVNIFELRELSKPLDSHDFEIYKEQKQKLSELEEKLTDVKDREQKLSRITNRPKLYELEEADFRNMSDKEKKYLFC